MARYHQRGLPLRVGLVAATLVLVACGLAVSGVAVTSILRHSLLNRADQTLLDASRSWVQAPRRISQLPYEGPNADRPPSKFYVRVIARDGRSWQAINDSHAEPARTARPPDHGRVRPLRRPAHPALPDLAAGRYRGGGAAGPGRRRLRGRAPQ